MKYLTSNSVLASVWWLSGIFVTALVLPGCSGFGASPSEDIARSTSAIVSLPAGCSPLGNCAVQTTLPVGSTLGNFALVAAQSVRLAPRAHATDSLGQSAAIFALGSEGLAVGNGATTGSLISGGDVWLDAASVVSGFVSATGHLHPQTGATVTGAIREGISLSTYNVNVVPSVTMPTTWQTAVSLEPNETRNIQPGAYSGINIKTGATLSLATGRYFVTSLYLEPGGTLKMDNTAGPVEVHVLDQFSCKGQWQPTVGSSNVRVVFWGTNWLVSECTLASTTLVAPNAPVRIADRMTSGQIIAKSIEIGADATAVLKPFHALTTGPGGIKLKDLTAAQRQNACSAFAQFYTTADKDADCRVRAWNSVRAAKPATDAEAVTQCTQAYDACIANSNCDSNVTVPVTCGATVDQRDACAESMQPFITNAFVGLPACANFTLFRAYTYRPTAPLPNIPECAVLKGCF